MDTADNIRRVLENKESLLNLHPFDGAQLDFSYTKYIFKTIELSRRILPPFRTLISHIIDDTGIGPRDRRFFVQKVIRGESG
jgi:hypothetical protein